MEMSVNGMAPISEAKTCQLQQEQQQRRKRNAFLFDAPVLKGLLLGRTIK